MSDLAANSCEACRIDAPLVSDDEASVLLKEIEGWQLIDYGVKKLKKEFSFSNYSDSVDFSNKVADMAVAASLVLRRHSPRAISALHDSCARKLPLASQEQLECVPVALHALNHSKLSTGQQ